VADAALGQGFQVGDGHAVAVGQPEELAAVLGRVESSLPVRSRTWAS
jgi:hypothetical protein